LNVRMRAIAAFKTLTSRTCHIFAVKYLVS
jgi:hypothetical protein